VVADANGSEYQEDAVLSILTLYGPNGPCNELVVYLEKMEKVTKSNDTRQQTWRALFRCYDKMGRLADAREVARRVGDDVSAPDDIKAEALVYMGRADFAEKRYKDALDRFAECYSRFNNVYAAEAKYREALVYFETKDYETCLNSCYDQIEQFQYKAFDYWLGKSMILMGDAYLAKGDEFSAKATWNNVLESFSKVPEIYNEAKEKLAKLKNRNIQNNLIEE
jgi:tetratricopeptide (TPR) repeat protein